MHYRIFALHGGDFRGLFTADVLEPIKVPGTTQRTGEDTE